MKTKTEKKFPEVTLVLREIEKGEYSIVSFIRISGGTDLRRKTKLIVKK